jgi:hypothetical protein
VVHDIIRETFKKIIDKIKSLGEKKDISSALKELNQI